MKSYYLIVYFCISTLFTSVLFGQKNLSFDTVRISVLRSDFRPFLNAGTLLYRDSLCHKLVIENDLPDPVLFSEFGPHSSEEEFVTIKVVAPSDLILFPGEAVIVSEFYFVHKPPSSKGVSGGLDVRYSVGTQVHNNDIHIDVQLVLDSLLMQPCYSVSYDNLTFGPVILDGQVSKTITFTSNRREPVTISASSTSVDAGAFIFQAEFPILLPPLGTQTAQIMYHPLSNVPVVKYRHGVEVRLSGNWDGDQCNLMAITFGGSALLPTPDSLATPLFPDEKQILAFVGEMQPTVKTFHFTNNTSGNLKIMSVSMKNGTSFRINNVTPSNTFPFDLAAGANMTVDVEMFDVSQGVHYDELVIVVDKAADALHFELQGLQKEGTASVRTGAQGNVELAVYPNPSSSTMTFTLNGADRGELEVVDVLGNTLYRAQLDNMLIWNGSTLTNTKLPAGSYIARIRSTDPAKPFIASKIFIVQ